MKALRVRVENGRITGEAPAGLPDEDVYLCIAEEDDGMSAVELERLNDALARGFAWLRAAQTPSGSLHGDYDGPLFLLPGYVFAHFATGSELPASVRAELLATLRATRNADGGWGLYFTGPSTLFTTVLGYVAMRLLGAAAMQIRPRKGQFVVFDKAAAPLLRTIVLPVPGERTKGVVLTRTIFGNLMVGPTAEEQEDRIHASVERELGQAQRHRDHQRRDGRVFA